nr:hypothetical protein HK105_001995 [Polyrhizophydium stewartii]
MHAGASPLNQDARTITHSHAAYRRPHGMTSTPAARASTTEPASQSHDRQAIQAKLLFDEGMAKWNSQDVSGALMAFEKSVRTKPSSDAHYNLANCYHHMGDRQRALEHWKLSLEQQPRADAHVNIANALALFERKVDAAIPHYEAAVELEPEDGEIRYNFGVVLEAASRLDDAAEHFVIANKLGIAKAGERLERVLKKILSTKPDAPKKD